MALLVKATVLLAAIVLPAYVLGDTVANCTYEDIKGTWIFHMSQAGYSNTIDCTTGELKEVKQYTVNLLFPDLAVDQNGVKGFWTMIYNQGFEVVIGKHKFFAFSKYKISPKSPPVSICDQTLPGWYHDLWDHNWACYIGTKVEKNEVKVGVLPVIDLKSKFIKNIDFIDRINAKTNLWKAAHYAELEGMTLMDRLNRAGGVPKYGRYQFPYTVQPSEDVLKKVSMLPESFDWRYYNGVNYISPVRNQGQCGSCYAFGSMGMLEGRIRILSKNSMQPVFSTQDIVSCSNYAQGCDGGFPYLIAGKYGEDFGVVQESCFPYTGNNSDCSNESQNCFRYYTTDYYYIGGFYGACNEEEMLLELVNNGPIAVSFEVYSDFEKYKSGIYHHTGLEDKFNPWEITNHVVVIVGYGVENGTKYWIVKNSWGEDWGENGYFRILRGVDETSIESMAVAATPVLP